MPVAFDPFAFGLAVLVAVLAITAFRRDRAVILKILHVESGWTQDVSENHGKPYAEFRLVIRNVGISMHNVRVCIMFQPRSMGGSVTVPLYRYSPITRTLMGDKDAEFAHGMVADFRLRTFWLSHEIRLLAALEDPVAQKAYICVFSDGCYLATQWAIGVGPDNIKRRWNEMADRLNRLFDSRITKAGKHPLFKPGNVLRHAPSLYWPVRHFAGVAREERKNPAVPMTQKPITVFTADDETPSSALLQ